MASKVFRDKRTKEVLTYFEDIKLLFTNIEKRKPKLPLSVVEALWVAENAEPRVLELLPSAIVNYPNDWKKLDKLPKEIQEIIKNIENGTTPEIDYYKGIAVREMLRWADLGNIDGRRKAPDKKKKLCSFRFNQRIVNLLKEKSEQANLSQSDYIGMLVEKS